MKHNNDAWLWEQSATAAREAWQTYMRGECSTCYLHYKQGELRAFPEYLDAPAAGYALGEAERMPSNLTVEQLTRWVYDRARRLPCLPEA